MTLAAAHARRAARRQRVDSAAEAVRVKVTKEMEARRQAAKLRQQRERERRMEAVRAALREASGACARARAEVAKRVRGALEVGRVACAAASEELERATSRQIIDWQSRRWAVGWSVGWAAERAARANAQQGYFSAPRYGSAIGIAKPSRFHHVFSRYLSALEYAVGLMDMPRPNLWERPGRWIGSRRCALVGLITHTLRTLAGGRLSLLSL